MAKANDKSSTIDWIWLHDALMLAIPRFGSVVLSKERLTEWLAAGKLPWSCMSWWGLDAEGIARLDQENRVSIVLHIIPTVAFHEGDPRFWRANVKIFWEENGAREQATGGARALGIRVSLERLRALLPEEPREGEEVRLALPQRRQERRAPEHRLRLVDRELDERLLVLLRALCVRLVSRQREARLLEALHARRPHRPVEALAVRAEPDDALLAAEARTQQMPVKSNLIY